MAIHVCACEHMHIDFVFLMKTDQEKVTISARHPTLTAPSWGMSSSQLSNLDILEVMPECDRGYCVTTSELCV